MSNDDDPVFAPAFCLLVCGTICSLLLWTPWHVVLALFGLGVYLLCVSRSGRLLASLFFFVMFVSFDTDRRCIHAFFDRIAKEFVREYHVGAQEREGTVPHD